MSIVLSYQLPSGYHVTKHYKYLKSDSFFTVNLSIEKSKSYFKPIKKTQLKNPSIFFQCFRIKRILTRFAFFRNTNNFKIKLLVYYMFAIKRNKKISISHVENYKIFGPHFLRKQHMKN